MARIAMIDRATLIVRGIAIADDGVMTNDDTTIVTPASATAGPGDIFDAATGLFSKPPVLPARKSELHDAVMALRDEKVDAGIAFSGASFQTRADDRENIAGAAQLAGLWMAGGGDPQSLRWASDQSDFAWIAADNSLVPMPAATVIAFAKAVAAMKSQCIFNARALKDQIEAAADVAALDLIDISAGWPA